LDRGYEIIKALDRHPDGLSIPEIVSSTGLSTGIVRREIDVLIATGAIRSHLRRPNGPGRRGYRYTLTHTPTSALLLMMSIVIDLANTDPESAAKLLNAAKATGANMVDGPYPDAIIERSADVGFAPMEITTGQDELSGLTRFRFTACPVYEAVRHHNGAIICQLHREMVRGGTESFGAQLVQFDTSRPISPGCEVAIRRVFTEFTDTANRMTRMESESRGDPAS